MRSVPAISIVLPTFNRAHCLQRAIQSVLWQTWQDFELIVVDDGSRDATMELLGTVADPRLRVIRHETTRGASAARNSGIEAARATWVAFQDSDDIWLPDKLERQINLAESLDLRPFVVWCGKLTLSSRTSCYQPSNWQVLQAAPMIPSLLWGPVIGTQTLLVRRDQLVVVGGFDETLEACEDWDLAIRLATRGGFAHIADVLVLAPKAQDGLSMNPDRGLRSRERVFEKHRKLFAAYPEIEASNLYDLGYLAMITGDVDRARNHFRDAARRQPLRPKYAAAFFSSFVGRAGFLKSLGLYGRIRGAGRAAFERVT